MRSTRSRRRACTAARTGWGAPGYAMPGVARADEQFLPIAETRFKRQKPKEEGMPEQAPPRARAPAAVKADAGRSAAPLRKVQQAPALRPVLSLSPAPYHPPPMHPQHHQYHPQQHHMQQHPHHQQPPYPPSRQDNFAEHHLGRPRSVLSPSDGSAPSRREPRLIVSSSPRY